MVSERQSLSAAFALGKAAGSIHEAQAAECPYLHCDAQQRHDWLDGFSAGRAELRASGAIQSVSPTLEFKESPRRAVPFGSQVVYHYSTRTIAVDFLDDMKVLGPFDDEDAAFQAAFAFVETRRASLDRS